MVTPIDIFDELKKQIEEQFHGEPVYTKLIPKDFDRPCSQIVLGDYEGDVDYGCEIVELRPVYSLTTYVPGDAYHQFDQRELNLRQMRLLAILLPGYIRVKDRAVKVAGIKMTGDYESNSVIVTFAYTLDRSDFMDIPQTPTIGELHIRQEVKTYG